jgi:hypothetical protein
MLAATKIPESTRALAQALILQGCGLRAVSERTGVNHRTVQTWARRYGWRELRDKTKQEVNPTTGAEPGTGLVIASLTRTESSALCRLGDETRERLAQALNAQAKLLVNQPPTKRAELTGRDGTAQALKTLADAGNVVHGWGEGTVPGIIVMGDVERCRPDELPAKVSECATAAPGAGEPGGPALEVAPMVETQAEVVPLASEPGASR